MNKPRNAANHTIQTNEDIKGQDESQLIQTIKSRYSQDLVYTHVGASAVVSVNPLKTLGSNSDATIASYVKHAVDTAPEKKELQAHVFDIAESCYRHMRKDRSDQAVIIKYV